MAKVRRGILINLGSALLLISIVYLLFYLSQYTNYFKSINANLAPLEITGSSSDSASTGIISLVTIELANVTFQSTNVSIRGNMSNVIGLYTDADRYVQFAQTYSPSNLSINTTTIKLPSINILPQQIRVNYSIGRVTFTPMNTSSSYRNVSGYTFLFKINKPTPVLNWTNLSTVSSNNIDALYFRIAFQGTNGTTFNVNYLNKSKLSSLSILNTTNGTFMSIQINHPAAIQVNYDLNTSTVMEAILELNSTATRAEIDTNIINITGDVQTGDKVILSES